MKNMVNNEKLTLSLENISKNYYAKNIISNLSCEFTQGCHGILGPNGSGKTTFLKIICGAESLTNGDVILNGISLKRNHVLFKKQVGYAPDKLMVYPFLTGKEFINMITRIKKPDDKEEMHEILDGLKIASYLSVRFDEMSLGNQKKYMLFASFIGSPPVLILDEPTNEIDIESKEFIINYLNRVKEQKIIIFSSHDAAFLSRLGAKRHTLSLGTNGRFE